MDTLKSYVDSWTNFIGTSITGLFLTVATAIFFYSVVRFILKRSSGDVKGLKDAKGMLGWSIIGLTVMFSIWGIVSFLQSGILGENASKTSITAPSISAGGGTSGSGVTPASGRSTAGRSGSSGYGNTSGRPLVGVGGSCRISQECSGDLICLAAVCTRPSTAGAGRGGTNRY